MPYTIENQTRIYDDDTGEYVSISPDADGLMCVELRQSDLHGNIQARITMSPDLARLVAKAFSAYMDSEHPAR